MDFKPITITLQGYSIEGAHIAVLKKAIKDHPTATDARIAQMLGVSYSTVRNWCKEHQIDREPKMSRKILSAIQLLKNKGFTVANTRGQAVNSFENTHKGPRGRKKTSIPFESLERGDYLTVPNLMLSSVKNYGQAWIKSQPDPNIRFRYAEDSEGVKVFRHA